MFCTVDVKQRSAHIYPLGTSSAMRPYNEPDVRNLNGLPIRKVVMPQRCLVFVQWIVTVFKSSVQGLEFRVSQTFPCTFKVWAYVVEVRLSQMAPCAFKGLG